MIVLQPQEPGKPPATHAVDCVKSIGTFKKGEHYLTNIMLMHGRIYKPGKDAKGKFLDTVGEPDNRLMIFSTNSYATATKEVLDQHFNER